MASHAVLQADAVPTPTPADEPATAARARTAPPPARRRPVPPGNGHEKATALARPSGRSPCCSRCRATSRSEYRYSTFVSATTPFPVIGMNRNLHSAAKRLEPRFCAPARERMSSLRTRLSQPGRDSENGYYLSPGRGSPLLTQHLGIPVLPRPAKTVASAIHAYTADRSPTFRSRVQDSTLMSS